MIALFCQYVRKHGVAPQLGFEHLTHWFTVRRNGEDHLWRRNPPM